MTTTMPYFPGRRQRVDLQVYYDGRWNSAGLGVLRARQERQVGRAAPGARYESGIRARMRAVYVDGASGDNVNSTTFGGWKYLYFSN